MKKYSPVLILFMVLTVVNSITAQPKGYRTLKDTVSFKKNFNDKSKKINTNEADFIQEKYIAVMTEKAISKGKFYFKKPNLMRWEITEPTSHVIVLNNGKMVIREKGKVKTFDSNA